MRNIMLAIAITGVCCKVACAADTPATIKGMTMRIQQSTEMQDDTAQSDLRLWLAEGDKFRIEGDIVLKKRETKIPTLIVGAGALVSQVTKLPMGTQAFTVDLTRIREKLPKLNYSPAKTYDPTVYAPYLEKLEDKRSLEKQKLDGVETEGWEFLPKGGRFTLPCNVPMALPEPAKVRVWLGVKDKIARRVEMEDKDGHAIMKSDYSEVKLDVQIPATQFVMNWPEGVEPVDATDKIMTGIARNIVESQSAQPGAAKEEKP